MGETRRDETRRAPQAIVVFIFNIIITITIRDVCSFHIPCPHPRPSSRRGGRSGSGVHTSRDNFRVRVTRALSQNRARHLCASVSVWGVIVVWFGALSYIERGVSLRLQSRFYFRVFFEHANCLVEKPRASAAVSTQTSTGGRRPCTTRGALLRRDRTESEGGIRRPDLGPRRQDTPGKNGRWVLSFGV